MSVEPARSDVGADGSHRLTSDEVAARLKVDPRVGLPASQVASRLAAHGPNRLPPRAAALAASHVCRPVPQSPHRGPARRRGVGRDRR
ncbi:cation-transporting P-type ATPase [Pengzhenrongella frigida]|uniref:Cation-transporting P-type ATPase N-terminal domain-containing protein n=1 Tax=Pengzhenrongella frigida TaxID=1259133 RepID=A0A4V1ZGR2_9MICO|nr:hypothetical protein EUA98_18770 [Cellulomonas sp. HLT2-17]